MRIDDLMLFLDIERLKVVRSANCFDCIVSSVLSLIDCMNAFWIVVSDVLVYHLSSTWATHEILVVVNKVDRRFF